MSADPSPDRAVAAIAAENDTIVTREELLACGVGRTGISHRLRNGRLHIVFRTVYSVGCGELPPRARERAALAVCGEGALLSHQTAAYLWGMQAVAPESVSVTVVGRYVRSRDGLRVHRIDSIDPRDVRRKSGMVISSPARSLLEISAELAFGELEEAVDEALRRRLVTGPELLALLDRSTGRRGSRRLRSLFERGSGVALSRSQAEKRFRELVRSAGLPQPQSNIRLGRFEVDFLWRPEALVVEVDGFAFHRDRTTFESDRRRDVELRAAGFTVLRFTERQLTNEPEVVLVRLGQVMALSLRGRAE